MFDTDFFNKISNGVIIGVILGIITTVSVLLKKGFFDGLLPWLKNSASVSEFSLDDIKFYQKHFISNHVKIYNHNKRIQLDNHFFGENEHRKILARLILKGKIKHSFLVAPTGIGKTTFLVNLFISLKKLTVGKNSKKIVLGKVYSGKTEMKINELIKSGESKKTILLLDGLDEFYTDEYNSSNDFWDSFNKTWDSLRNEKLKYFSLVIITVREQFLEYDKKGTSSKIVGITSKTINNNPISFINIQEFNNKQIETYISKRYKKSKYHTREVISKIRNSNPELLSIPLILDFLEYISVEKLSSYGLIKFEIYEAIIDGWLYREINQGKLDEKDRSKLLNFCTEMAWATVNNSEQRIFTLNKKFIDEFENKSFMRGLENRALLKREINKEISVVKFTHNSILEYFLVLYVEKSDENENKFPFHLYNLTKEFLIAKRWKEIKKSTPKIEAKHLGTQQKNVLSKNKIKRWLESLRAISCNDYIKSELKNDLGSCLKKDDLAWRLIFEPIANWVVTKENFFNEHYTIDENTFEFISYTKDFIYEVSLRSFFESIPISSENLINGFSCFSGIRNLKSLELNGFSSGNGYFESRTSILNSTVFENFKHSRDSLISLSLYHTFVRDEDIFVFHGMSSLIHLSIAGTLISDLSIFKKSKKIRGLNLTKAINLIDKIDSVNSFIKPLKLEMLGIGYLNFDDGIFQIENSIDSLTHLNIVGSNISLINDLNLFKRLEQLITYNSNLIQNDTFSILNSRGVIIESLTEDLKVY